MADKTVAPFDGTTDSGNIQIPLRGTASANLEANGLAVVAATDTLIIQAEYNDDVEIFVQAGAGTSAISFAAGDNPPSMNKGKGAALFSVPNGETWRIILEAQRHVKSNGDIRATVATTDASVWVFRAPAGFVGVGITNRRSIAAAPSI